jgi:hypothetical protein
MILFITKDLLASFSQYHPPLNNEHERAQALYFVLSFCLATMR